MTLRIKPSELVEEAEASGRPGLLARAPHWTRTPVRDIARVINGAPFKSSMFNSDGRGMPLIRIRDVGRSTTNTYYDGPFDDIHVVRRGDILIGMDGDFRVARWQGPEALLNQRVCKLLVDDDLYDSRLLVLVIQGYLDAIWSATSSLTVKHLSSRSILDIPLPSPPLEEQQRIVTILEDHLSRLDAGGRLLDAAGSRLRTFLAGGITEATTSVPVVLRPLEAVVEGVEAGKSFGSAARPAEPGEWGIIKVSAMTWGEFRPDENKVVTQVGRVDPRFEIKAGDVLVSRANTAAYVGAPVLVRSCRPRLLLSDKSLRLVPRDGVDPEWLVTVLSAPASRRQITARATGTKDSMRNIAQAALLSIEVPVPEQGGQNVVVRKAAIVSETAASMELELSAVNRRVSAARRALLQAAFSGRLTSAKQLGDQQRELAGV